MPRTSGAGRPALWTGAATVFIQHRQHLLPRSITMAHKKVERKKELDRRRHRREQRLKERIHEAQAAARSGKKERREGPDSPRGDRKTKADLTAFRFPSAKVPRRRLPLSPRGEGSHPSHFQPACQNHCRRFSARFSDVRATVHHFFRPARPGSPSVDRLLRSLDRTSAIRSFHAYLRIPVPPLP